MGAPSYELFGAYFPGWMLCALAGIAVAIAARAAMLATGLASRLPFQLGVCAALGTLAALAIWLAGVGR